LIAFDYALAGTLSLILHWDLNLSPRLVVLVSTVGRVQWLRVRAHYCAQVTLL
jgi:hypothetical protein